MSTLTSYIDVKRGRHAMYDRCFKAKVDASRTIFVTGATGFLGHYAVRDLLQGDSVLIVEWPERAGDRLRAADLTLSVAYEGDGRTVSFAAASEAGGRVLAGLRLDPD